MIKNIDLTTNYLKKADCKSNGEDQHHWYEKYMEAHNEQAAILKQKVLDTTECVYIRGYAVVNCGAWLISEAIFPNPTQEFLNNYQNDGWTDDFHLIKGKSKKLIGISGFIPNDEIYTALVEGEDISSYYTDWEDGKTIIKQYTQAQLAAKEISKKRSGFGF